MKLFFLLLLSSTLFSFSNNVKFKILDIYELKQQHDKKVISELSALAYRDKVLYALSDKGLLYHFKLTIEDKKIKDIELLKAYKLRNKKGKRFSKKKRDAEGLAFYKDGLLVSFEGKNRVLFVSFEGIKRAKITLSKELKNNSDFVSSNKGLESVAYSKKYGVLTIPELPLKRRDAHYHYLYAKDRVWKFQAQGAVTDIVMMDDERVMVLLREFSYFKRGRKSSIVSFDLSKCKKNSLCKTETLILLDSQKGDVVENFEGLTKIKENLYLMVSDDNDSWFQKTLFVLFEIRN
ncbi:MAG: esterase-like activity of phytase family protein [Sulfurimonas sp.]